MLLDEPVEEQYLEDINSATFLTGSFLCLALLVEDLIVVSETIRRQQNEKVYRFIHYIG